MLQLLRVGTLVLLLLDLGNHLLLLLLLLRRAHYAPSALLHLLLELVVHVVLGGHASTLLSLLELSLLGPGPGAGAHPWLWA